MDEVIVQGMPESLRQYITDDCSIPAAAFTLMPGEKLPQPAQKLLFHKQDMTSTLERFHNAQLYVDCIQRYEIDEIYLREVFLKTRDKDKVVEYGVIAIVLDNFSREQRLIIEADYEPFGGLLHKFGIEFKSAPVCFFSIHADYLEDTPFKRIKNCLLYGRFNSLSKPDGRTLAWIMEILPETS